MTETKEIRLLIETLSNAPEGSAIAAYIGKAFYVYPDRHPPAADGGPVNTKAVMVVSPDNKRFWATMEMFE